MCCMKVRRWPFKSKENLTTNRKAQQQGLHMAVDSDFHTWCSLGLRVAVCHLAEAEWFAGTRSHRGLILRLPELSN